MTSMILVQLGEGPLGLLAKVSAILACTALVATLLVRASAALRHAIWFGGLAAALGLAIAWPFAPRLDVGLPPALVAATVASTIETTASVYAVSAAPVRSTANTIRTFPARRVSQRWTRTTVAIGIPQLLFAAWLIGTILFVARAVVGHVIIERIVRGARDATNEWSDPAALQRGGVRRDVRILISGEIEGPVTAGFLNPIIIVPLGASEWSAERCEIVLTHELAHVARFDFLAQLIASITCAVFWFHPLVWIAAARLRAEAEHAADDRVLAGGTPGVSYATHLLDLARVDSATRLSAAVAVGMVRASRLEGRVRAMLDVDRSRATVSPRAQALATSLTLAAMVPIAGLRASSAPVPMPTAAPAFVAQARQVTADSLFEKTLNAKSRELLTLDLKTGGDVTIRGWDAEQVRVRGHLGGEDWRATRVSLERWERGVRLHSEFDGSSNRRMTRHSFEIWVPRRMNVDLQSSGGSLAINDLTGEFRGQTGGGTIMIEGAKGSASLSTGGGNVRVSNSALEGTVATGGGEVIIANVAGGLRASSGSGPVIHVPGIIESGSAIAGGSGSNATTTTISGSASGGFGGTSVTSSASGGGYGRGGGFGGAIQATTAGGGGRGVGGGVGGTTSTNVVGYETLSTITASGVTTNIVSSTSDRMLGATSGYAISKAGGSIEISDVPNGAQLRTGGGNIWVGSANGLLGVSTGGGDIELPRVSGSVSAWTGGGDVTITVVDAGNAEHSVEVFTGRGGVVLELPSNLDARFELETAYTESKPRTKIESDFSLQSSETSDWDDRQGTPRKYVRATGSVGNGRGLIRIRVVNGDIVIRRGR